MGRAIGVLLGVGILAVAVTIANRMSSDAIAIVVGLVCGLGASVLVTIALLFLLNRRAEQPAAPPAQTVYMIQGDMNIYQGTPAPAAQSSRWPVLGAPAETGDVVNGTCYELPAGNRPAVYTPQLRPRRSYQQLGSGGYDQIRDR